MISVEQPQVKPQPRKQFESLNARRLGVPRVPVFGTRVLGLTFLFLLSVLGVALSSHSCTSMLTIPASPPQ
jgi:hypothetical protein